MKKVLVLNLILCILLTGCNYTLSDWIPNAYKSFEEVGDINANGDYRTAQVEAMSLSRIIKRKDVQALKDKFSPYAKKRIENFDEKVERFINEFPDWNMNYEEWNKNIEINTAMERCSDYGKITYMRMPHFNFKVNGVKYRFEMIFYTESDEDESKLGYYSLQIMDLDASYTDGVYMHGVEDEPDILLWDYLKDE